MPCLDLKLTTRVLLPIATAVLCWGSAALAQEGREPLLKGAQVTEAALVDALALDAPVAAGLPRTRGFRPATPAADAAAPAHKGKANLLMTFPTDSAELTTDTRKMLDVLARALQSETLARNSFKIEGHADARGDAGNNRTLSQARAEAVASYLVHRHNIDSQRLVPVGKGAAEPLNTARVDAPENRRVTIVTSRN